MTLGAMAIQRLELERLRTPTSYKLHLATDAAVELPLACIVAPANEN
jgi:hypothetical protein